MNKIAVEGCTLQCTAGVGTVKINTLPSEVVLLDGKKAYRGTLNISISNYTDSVVTKASGKGAIKPNALYTKIDGELAVLETAITEEIIVTGVSTEDPDVTATSKTKVKVVTAGQTDISGD